MNTNPPAGWYPDPADPSRRRWWDGRAWAAAGPTPPTAPPSSATPPWLWPTVGGASAGIVALIALLSGGFASFFVVLGLIALGTGIYVVASARPSWLRLRGRRAGTWVLGAGAAAVILGSVWAGASTRAVEADPDPAAIELAAPDAEPGPGRSATPSRTPTPTPTPVISEVVETEAIPFARVSMDDPARDVGQNAIVVAGVDGVRTKFYSVTVVGGAETSRELIREEVTLAPVDEVTAVGVRQPAPPAPAPPAPAPQAPGGCHASYQGPCVPVAEDVDCAGGSGNGPAYIQGPVYIVGPDVYDLDRDGDGVACE